MEYEVSKKRAALWVVATIVGPLLFYLLISGWYIGMWYAQTKHQGAPTPEIIIKSMFIGYPLSSGNLGNGCSLVVDLQEEGRIRGSLPDAKQCHRLRHRNRDWSRSFVGCGVRFDGRCVLAGDVHFRFSQAGVGPHIAERRFLRGIPVPRIPFLAACRCRGGQRVALGRRVNCFWAESLFLGTLGYVVDHGARVYPRSCRALARERMACRCCAHTLEPLH